VNRKPDRPYYTFTHRTRLDGVRIGVVREYMDKALFTQADVESIDIVNQAIADLQQLGATIAVTGFGLGPEIGGMADVTLELGPDTSLVPDALRPPLDVIFGQLLGLFCSLEAGLKPDTPSPSGAISRVVSHVKIHPATTRRADPVPEIK
jgi:hypothetical protein